MKPLLVTIEYPPYKGGIANYYGNLAASWPGSETLAVLNNNQNELMAAGGFWSWRRAFKTIKNRVKKEGLDYILVGQVLPLGTAVWALSFFCPIRYAVIFHGMDLNYSLRRPRKRFLTRMIINRADKIICANSYVKAELAKYYPRGSAKAIIINPGIGGEIFPVRAETSRRLKEDYGLGENGRPIVLFTLGRLVKRKGVDKVIAALSSLPDQLLDNLKYVIAGSGPDQKYLQALIPDRLKDKIIFLGELSEEEKWAWLNLCDIFIMPARNIQGDYEGFGIVYLEANLCAKPVIAGLAGGMADAVLDSYNGLMVDPEDPASIKDAIIKLAADKDWRDKLGRQGQARALKEFKWPALVEKLKRELQK